MKRALGVGLLLLAGCPSGVRSFTFGGWPSQAHTGQTVSFTLSATRNGTPANDYRGTVHFTSDDSGAALPADYPFTSGDQGVHGFSVSFSQAGSRSVTATDASNHNIVASAPLTVLAAAELRKSSGDGQSAVAGTPLAQPLTVEVIDTLGNPVSGVAVQWAVVSGGGAVSLAPSTSDLNGLATTTATVGTPPGPNAFQATSNGVSPVQFSASGTSGLTYADPAPGGKIRLVRNPASTADTLVLDLVANAPLTGFSVALNLPLDGSKVQLDAAGLTPGTALPAGQPPLAAGATLPLSGPLANVLVSGQSQKGAGAGAVPTDSSIASSSVLYTLRLDRVSGATPGVVFDGAALGPAFRAALRNRLGSDQVSSGQFAIGRLDAR